MKRPLLHGLLSSALLLALATPARADDLVVRFKHDVSPAQAARALAKADLGPARPGPGGAVVAAVKAGDRGAALRALDAQRPVAWASPSYRAHIAGVEHNDTGTAARGASAGGWSSAQWDFTGPFGMRAPEAWALAEAAGAPGGRGILVAVLDTGAAYSDRGAFRRSPDLPASRVRPGRDFVDGDNRPNDANGHGTFVTSTIAAAADNGYGMVGVAYRATVMPVRVLDAYGEGSSARVAQGIRYAARRGARVINVSIELSDDRGPISLTAAPDIRSALRYARARNVVVVAAAGNSSDFSVPSSRNGTGLIQVGGSTEHGCLADYSNTGAGVDVLAPGGGADAYLPDDVRCRPDAQEGRSIAQVTFRRGRPARFYVPRDYFGTSMAAPHVTGAIALLLGARTIGVRPTPAAVEQRVKATARDEGRVGPDRSYASGLLDAARLLGGPPPPPDPVAEPATPAD